MKYGVIWKNLGVKTLKIQRNKGVMENPDYVNSMFKFNVKDDETVSNWLWLWYGFSFISFSSIIAWFEMNLSIWVVVDIKIWYFTLDKWINNFLIDSPAWKIVGPCHDLLVMPVGRTCFWESV